LINIEQKRGALPPFFVAVVLISLISPRFESSIKVFALRGQPQAIDFRQFLFQFIVCGVSAGYIDDDHASFEIFVLKGFRQCTSAFK
jgi:hypothetical protein